MGGPGSSSRAPDTIAVHYGADDNASGVAGVMEISEFMVSRSPARTMVFTTFGAEEMGLVGSKYLSENSPFDLSDIQVMINLDMVGNGTGFFVASGKSYPEIYKHFETANNNFLHRIMDASETRKNYGRPRSDASIFENAGIKTLGLWTRNSVHPVHYHLPMDKTNILTPEIMEDAAKLLYLGILGVANDESL